MSQFFILHADSPQPRLIKHAVEILEGGGVIAYPTDSGYALGCMVGNASAQARIRQIRGVDDKHLFTLVCRDLSEIGTYAVVNNSQFRLLKANTPGAYTFILKASREVPKKLQHAKRSTVGIRVPQHRVVQAMLEALNAPILSMTLHFVATDEVPTEAWDVREKLEHWVDLVIDAGHCAQQSTTIIDLTETEPVLIRAGLGDLAPFGLNAY